MAVNFKDYYATLGVSREAPIEEIKRAYRALARKHHPDKAAPEERPAAEARIKEINEAYAVLKDPEKRKKYDRLGEHWDQPEMAGGGFGGRGFPRHSAGDFHTHFGGTGFSDFFEQMFGTGAGAVPEREKTIESDIMVPLEEAVRGATREISLRSTDPFTGQERVQTFKVRIPAGVRDGQRLRVPMPGGEPGRIHLVVRIAPHPEFRVREGNIYHDLELAPWEAVLGAKIEVPTLTGAVRLTIPPGTPHGRRFRLKGRGLPGLRGGEAGDLFVEVALQVPQSLNAQEREQWETLAQTSTFNPRA